MSLKNEPVSVEIESCAPSYEQPQVHNELAEPVDAKKHAFDDGRTPHTKPQTLNPQP